MMAKGHNKRTVLTRYNIFTLQGFSHPIKTNGSGAPLLDYLILDTDGLSWELKPTHKYTRTEFKCLVINRIEYF